MPTNNNLWCYVHKAFSLTSCQYSLQDVLRNSYQRGQGLMHALYKYCAIVTVLVNAGLIIHTKRCQGSMPTNIVL